MRIIIDIDGTICSEENFDNRKNAKPFKKAINQINIFKKKKYKIIFYSSRPWSQYELTLKWLKKNKLKFDNLILGKPIGDLWIDDRSVVPKNWNLINKKVKHIIKNKKF
jgi:hypothetical protein